ncbi:MAG TPA: cytochrome c biogenesis heme-transporting ATPase CcmA [Gammaproteobacteria bacterium]|nr:cytochrome c biogenesis heme-transporting ATPase CcmA [Gammaproteobacteria bacterium]
MLTAYDLESVRNDQVIFSSVNFTLFPGEILHISGANGCGKSTLLHILMGLLLPEKGEVRWRDVLIGECAAAYQAQLLYIGHKIGVKNTLTVRENLQLAAKLGKGVLDLDLQQALRYFNLHSLQDMVCAHLSAGQRQRVALTRLLILEAGLWILDEPFTAIDSESVVLLQDLIQQQVQRGGMVVLTSHQPFALPGVKELRLC